MSDESLFREVDEEVRQEQFKKLWARYGNIVIAVCLLVIVGVGGVEGWRYWQAKQAESAGESFFTAADLAGAGKTDEALTQFNSIEHDGFALLANLREANALAAAGKPDEAVKAYDQLAADGRADQTLRDLARLRAAAVLANSASLADIESRLKGLDAETSPWRHMAREIMASAQWRLKDYAGADKQVQAILGDPETPPSLRQRAEMMAQVLQPLVAAK
ncbi:tetratricopeptide repeat protein [Aestuariivirga sp.]|uniref:tetratricopeptide repeat protein n=1 Tax=Aestuariivirga sp. TaxID=2650926 RepID=UPI003918E926